KKTIWFRVSTWEKTAEACNNYLKKGNRVLVEGRLNADDRGSPRIWNRQDGSPAASFEITANTVRFLTLKSEGEGEGEAGEEGLESVAKDEEIPF
ncbi:MAG: single-stranded DNA-binding protein, partial [Anaerolineaceae bacterium]|nr:single-stranded DNA-binding protein [Anaerolineaceae bacterium]